MIPVIRHLNPFGRIAIKTWAGEARLLYWLTWFWLAIGLVVLFSASFHTGLLESGNGFSYIWRQVCWILLGLVGFFAAIRSSLKKTLALGMPGFFVCLLLIYATHLPGMGTTAMGATRWLSIGGFQIQPSELMKPFLILQAAQVFGRWQRLLGRTQALWLCLFGLLLFGILRQPNLSTTALCGMSLWLIALAAGLPYWQLGMTAISGVGVAILSISFSTYQRLRVISFIDPWRYEMTDGYQLVQSLLAIGSGGLLGSGFGQSQQKLAFLPIHHTDFIFSIYAEEFGLIGGILLFLFLAIYGLLALRVAAKVKEPVHRLIAVGAMVVTLLQALINIGVSVGVLPTTGLPFPLFSYGGSSIVASLAISGLLIRVAREANQARVLRLPDGSASNEGTTHSGLGNLGVGNLGITGFGVPDLSARQAATADYNARAMDIATGKSGLTGSEIERRREIATRRRQSRQSS